MRYSNVTASLFPQPTLLAEPTITYSLVMPLLHASFKAFSTFKKLVLYHLWLCSIILKPTLHFFLQSGHLNWYSTSRTIALWGNLNPL